jgi:hypothetical protein
VKTVKIGTYYSGAAVIREGADWNTNLARLLIIIAAFAGAFVLYLLIDAYVVWRRRRSLRMLQLKQQTTKAEHPLATPPDSRNGKV